MTPTITTIAIPALTPSTTSATATLPLPTLDLTALAALPSGPALENPGSDWKVFVDQTYGLKFSYPPAWSEKNPGRMEGPDGYAWFETAPYDGAGLGAVCQAEANRGKPDRYGEYPLIIDRNMGEEPACLVLPSSDQPAARQTESLYLIWQPAAVQQGKLLVLHADRYHISAIVQSLNSTSPTSAAPVSHCDYEVNAAAGKTHVGGLRIDEFPIAKSAGCLPGQEAEAFNQKVSTGAAASRANEVVNSQRSAARLASLNTRLAPFGVRVEVINQLFRIRKGGTVLRSNLNWVGQLTINSAGTDFILPVLDSYNGATFLVRADGIHALDNWDLLLYDSVFPVFVGNDLISLAYDYQRYERPSNAPALVTVRKGDQVIDTFSVDGSTPAGGPVRGLWSWNGHWVMELPGLLIQDGKILNDTLGNSEMFTWRLLGGKPFYFFRKDGQIHVDYDGQVLAVLYDEVIYAPQWNIQALLQMKAYDNGLIFYARRGGIWYYVVIQAE